MAAEPRVGLVLDTRFEAHDTGPGMPERPERLRAIRAAVEGAGLVERLRRVEPERAGDDLLRLVHEPDHVARVEAACAAGHNWVDSQDVTICPESAEIARLATGSLVALCREVAEGRLDRGFCVVRPPGHHAERDLAMGFCLFNNVAIAARALQRDHGIRRVLIVDWDVHHGNGTQHAFEEDPDVFFFSLHQYPLYPGTGARGERGRGAGEGATLNCPLPPGSGDAAFLAALGEMEAAATAFRPEFVLVSAGFDAHVRDPLAQLEVTSGAYTEATAIVRRVAARHAEGKLVATLEGGYDLDALGESAALLTAGLL